MDEIVFTLITAIVGAIGVGVRQWLKATLTPTRLDSLASMVQAVISGAEEVGRVLDLDSAAKYEYAENALRNLAKQVGLRLSDAELNVLIHAFLYNQRKADELASESAQVEEFLAALEEGMAQDLEVSGAE